jgi:uncharacterized protein YjbI with pentapeptide repeats
MSRISDLRPIQGNRTRTNDLFVTVNLETGDLGTRNITRRELVNAIQQETFNSIAITGGNISNVIIRNSDLIDVTLENVTLNNPIINDGVLDDITITNSTITGTSFSAGQISNSTITNTNLSNGQLVNMIMSNSTITNTNFSDGQIQDSDITGGTATNLDLFDPNIELSEFFQLPFDDDDFFVVKDVINDKLVKINFRTLQDEIASNLEKVAKIYVDAYATKKGNGSYHRPFETLEEAFEALEFAPKPASISVLPGEYRTNGNLPLPDNCSIVSTNGQYSTTIIMNDGFEEQNCFLVGSGCYVQGFAFSNQRIDDLDNPSKGFGVAFRPGAVILRSPYIRDCSQISNYKRETIAAPLDPVNANPLVGRGGGVILVDRAVLNQNSLFPYILAFGATPRSPNGIGYCAKNGAGINGIGSITIFQRTAFYALNGGQVTLNNSGTQFGDISMRSNGNTVVVDPYETDVDLVKNESLSDEIFDDAETIINQMWDYLVSESGADYSGFDGAKCKRDIALIIQGVTNDLALGTNYWALINGIAYRRQSASLVINEQLTETVAAINFLKDETIKLIENSLASVQRVTDAYDEIIDILVNGVGNADPLFFSDTGISNHKNARDQLQANRAYIIDELISWINTNFPSFSYNEATCRRDTGFIVDAISHDLNYGTNIATLLNAESYFIGSSSQLPQNQKEPTAAAISQLGVICADIVLGVYEGQDTSNDVAGADESSKALSLANKIATVVLEDNLESLPRRPDIFDKSWIDNQFLVSRSNILLFKDVLKTKTLKYLGSEFSFIDETLTKRDAGFLLRSLTYDILTGSQTGTRNFIAGFFDYKGDRVFEPTNVYSYEKCHRDLKLIIEAVAFDTAFNSNFRSITAGSAYYRANSEKVLEAPQKQLTIDTIEQLRTLMVASLTDTDSINRVNEKLNIILNIFNNGLGAAPAVSLPNPTGYDVGFENARRLLVNNKTFIQDEIDAWIGVNFPALVYDEAKCRRDVGLIVDALRYDLTYGGNLETLVAAKSYFLGNMPQYGAGEKEATLGAFERLSDILGSILRGILITRSSGNTSTQDVSGTPGTLVASNFAQSRVQEIVLLIRTDGFNIPSTLRPSLAWVDSNFRESFNILDGETVILANTTLEIINKSDKTLLGAFLESYDFLRDYIVQNYTLSSDEQDMIVSLFDDVIKKTLLGPARLRFGSLIESIGHQFNLAGAGVNKNALPLNFRRVGRPLPASGSVLQQNGGRVRWSGADELNNQYFARGLKINGRTGRLEGRPFTSSVRRLARRAANSRVST